MTPVLVAASSPVIRAGLRSMVEDLSDFAYAGAAVPSSLVERVLELEPGVVLWQLLPDEDAAAALHALGTTPVLLLTQHPSMELIRAGARGVLPVDSTAEQIGAGLRAAACELVVLAPEAIHGPSHVPASTSLTARETEVLRMIGEGLANKEIAFRLGISEHTVKFHVSSVLGKLRASSRAEAIASGIRQGLILL